jgi:hypothetical protein
MWFIGFKPVVQVSKDTINGILKVVAIRMIIILLVSSAKSIGLD